jgi:hypothetical protein
MNEENQSETFPRSHIQVFWSHSTLLGQSMEGCRLGTGSKRVLWGLSCYPHSCRNPEGTELRGTTQGPLLQHCRSALVTTFGWHLGTMLVIFIHEEQRLCLSLYWLSHSGARAGLQISGKTEGRTSMTLCQRDHIGSYKRLMLSEAP